ncbi:PDR/VanB family oxidoreductase [Aeromicrobium sp. CTD01-1L150]|uniref:PDR/VanB family oxidoreductase n=1 Tax=Aeromicrobium sp. CTD01-1L150 TaxID=3341830 RepID=UPI0035BEC1B1
MSQRLTLPTADAGQDVRSAHARHVVVERIHREADGVLSLVLTDPGGHPLPSWSAGAHIDLLLAPGLERQYSLCGDVDDASQWRVAALRHPHSRGGSRFIHEELSEGDRLQVRGPRNHFPLTFDAESYLLIAGGIGITPLLPMARQLTEHGVDWTLLYGGRHLDSMAFVDELGRDGDRVCIRPQDRFGPLDLDAALGDPRPGLAVYCCGPEGLLTAVEERCARWPDGTLRVERFGAREQVPTNAATDQPFELVLARTGHVVTVGPGQSIIDAASRLGVRIPTSCREGVCGTCETDVIEGIPDHRDSLLTDKERESNATILPCCSWSRTPRLVLDC